MLNNCFKTTELDKLKVTREQQNLINKDIEFVRGSQYYPKYYDIKDESIQNTLVKYYQITIFQENNLNSVRSFLFEGSTNNVPCDYNYKILKIKENKLNKEDLNKFVSLLDREKKKKK